ncbi:filamentous hemagglutinin N-terminal domain-containing protein [Nostoc sp. CHAB 5844]|nr:filamentous hemagglutinin N-terminal domain-containing protein [Nostoc sp. CHAB 5844]
MFIRSLLMQPNWSKHWFPKGILSALVAGAVIETGHPVTAQIKPDNSLPRNSIVTPSGKTFVIEGGTTTGSNLFHSFTQFSLPTNNTAYFNNALSIQNIFTRVTGNNISNIDGLIRANGIANLFILNPNGIIFGPNARLDVGGSFVASTANRINFADGTHFSAKVPQTSQLLSISIPIGLQLNANSQNITNAGNLAVNSGENLTLLGGAVSSTGSLTAPGGTVQVLGKQIGLFDSARIDVSSENGGGTVLLGGDIQGKGAVPNAARTYVGPNVTIKADALTTGNGGKVVVWADEATGFYGNISARGGSISGNGGFVEVSGKQNLIFRGNVNTSAPFGVSGTLLLDPENITIANGSGDEVGDGTNSFAGNNSGIAGTILSAPLSQINDTAPATIYESELEGLSGDTNINLQATNNITLQNLTDNTLNLAAGNGNIAFTADADGNGVGNFVMDDLADTISTNGRDIAITGASLTLGNINTTLIVGGDLIAVDIDSGGAIPTMGTIGDATFTFTVPNLGENINNLDVQFSASHTYDSDLTVSLISPQGTELNLFDGVGGSGDNFQDTVLDDSATSDIVNGSSPFTGRFRPSGAGGLAVFNGQSPAGTWTLRVTDSFAGDSGTLYRQGDTAPWGTTLGTQLQFISPLTPVGSGAINLTATQGGINVGQLSAASLLSPTSSNNAIVNLRANQDITTGNISNTGRQIQITSTNGNINISGLITTSTNQLTNDFTPYPAGDISINAGGNITVSNEIRANSLRGAGGNITLTSGNTLLIGEGGFVNSESNLDNSSPLLQPGGDVNLNAPLIVLENTGRVNLTIVGAGQGGNLNVNADEINIINGGGLTSTTEGLGDSGDITINTRRLLIQTTIPASDITFENIDRFRTGVTTFVQRFPTSISFGTNDFETGRGGNITINATDSVELIGNRPGPFTPRFDLSTVATAVRLPAGITAGTIANGASGNVDINTNRLIVKDGSGISTASISPGSLPDIFPNVVTSFVDSQLPPGTPDFFRDLAIASVNAQLDNITRAGTGGDLTIRANQIDLQGTGGLTTATLSTSDAGDLTINANDGVTLSNGAAIAVSTFSQGDAGNINLTTNQLSVRDGSRVGGGTASVGFGGRVSITASEVELTGRSADGEVPSDLNAIALENSTGDAGDINVSTQLLTIKNGAQLSAAASGTGRPGDISVKNASLVALDGGAITSAVNSTAVVSNSTGGRIEIQTNQLSLTNGAKVTASTDGMGNAGSVTVRQADSVDLDNSSISTAVNTNAVGQGGNVEIQTRNLSLSNGSQLSAATSGTGDAGSIIIDSAESVNLSRSEISTAATNTSSNSGSVTINTRRLTVKDGSEVSAATVFNANQNITQPTFNSLAVFNAANAPISPGQAGNLNINATESVTLSGAGGLTVEAAAGGTAGNLTVNTNQFTISDGALVSVSSPQGQAGNVEITANSLFLNQGRITAETGSGEAGANIRLQIPDALFLSNESLISATANGRANGGNINIDTQFLVALPPEGLNGSDIIANAEFGNGGTININAEAIFGIEFQQQQTAFNDFTVSSEFGGQGEVQINSLTEPNSTLTELPENLVDSGRLITQNACQKNSESEFSITGRGGLPPTPTEALSNDVVWSDTRLTAFPMKAETQRKLAETTKFVPTVEAVEISPATSWVLDNQGVTLVSHTPKSTAKAFQSYSTSCPQR